MGDVLAAVHQRRQFGALRPLVGYLRVGSEDGFEPLAGAAVGLVPDLGEIFEVAGDVAVVPGDQDRLDVGEVLVQRRAADAGLGGALCIRLVQAGAGGMTGCRDDARAACSAPGELIVASFIQCSRDRAGG